MKVGSDSQQESSAPTSAAGLLQSHLYLMQVLVAVSVHPNRIVLVVDGRQGAELLGNATQTMSPTPFRLQRLPCSVEAMPGHSVLRL